MFKKRTLAMFLAFTFIIGFIPNVGLENVFADAPALIMNSSGFLIEGTNNDTPSLSVPGESQPNNAFMFNWNADQLSNGEKSVLDYWVKASEKVVVSTKRDIDDILVSISLESDGGTPINVADNLETIYNNQKKDYLAYNNYFDASGNKTSFNGYDNKSVEKSTATSAEFRLKLGTGTDVGYSIRYEKYELQFLLTKDGEFYFYQKNYFTKGHVYYPTLTHYDNLGALDKKEERAFSIGIDLKETVSTPFVIHEGTSEYEYYKYNIEDRQSTSIVDGDEVGFQYSLKLPLQYDETTKKFDKPVPHDATVKLDFKNAKGDIYLSVPIEVNADPAKETAVVTTSPAQLYDCKVSGNVLTVYFKGLDSGLLLTPEITYNFMYPVSTEENAIIKDKEKVAENLAYTFPEYTIINRDGTDYVEITPFEGYTGEYVLYSVASSKPGQEGNNIVNKPSYAASYLKDNAATKDKILLPLTTYNGKEIYVDYKIFFNPNGPFPDSSALYNNMGSQYPKYIKTRYFSYQVKDRGTVGFPNDFEITKVNQSKMFKQDANYTADGSGYYVESFKDTSYTLGWDLGKITSIDKMLDKGVADVTYKINLGDTLDNVTDDSQNQFLYVTFKLDGKGTAAQLVSFTDTFSKTAGGTPKDVLNDVIDARLTTKFSAQSSSYVYRLEIDVENVAIDANEKGNQPLVAQNLYFEYPNLYFFTVNPITVDFEDTTKTDLTIADTIESSVKSLTLNKDTSVELKEPIKVRVDNMVTQFIGEIDALGQTVTKDQVSLDFTYEQQQATLAEYMNYYFTNYDLANYGQNMKFTNDIYVSQDYDMMSKMLPNFTKAERDAVSTEFLFEDSKNSAGNYQVMMRAFANNSTDPAPLKPADGSAKVGVDILRNGGVVKIADVPLATNANTSGAAAYVLPSSNVVTTVQVNGLDTNAKYYFYVDTSVQYEKGNHRHINSDRIDANILDPKSSGISALSAGTTGSQMQTPSILDEVPTMPDITLVETGRNNYKTTWKKVDMTIADTNRYEQEFQYEVLRIRDAKLDDKYLDSRQDLKEVFANQIDTAISDKSAQLLLPDGTVLLYQPSTNTFVTPEAGVYTQTFDNNNGIIYEDNSLAANKVYFVYTRTVRVIKDKTTDKEYKLYSPWDVLSATTVLGDPPIDLKVVYNYASTYDPQTQIPLSFRAKVPVVDEIGKDITFQVTYQYDGKEWVTPITIDSATLRSSASAIDAEGYRTFTFMLSGLIPGKSYNIKVRQANSDGSFTIYSNTVQWKTEIDEDEYDKNDEVGAFEDLMDERVDSLIDGSQIVLSDGSEKVIMINGNNLSNEITNSTANTITINTLAKGKDNRIMIPFEAYQTANQKGMAWQFTNGDLFFNYSAKTIDPTYNPQVIALNKKIERDVLDDYFIEFVFDYQSTPTTLNGDTRLTDVVKLSNPLKATTENIVDFQEVALKEALEEVKNSSSVLAKKQAILDKIKAGMFAEDALKLVDEYVTYVQGLLQTNLNARITAIRQSRDDANVAKLDKNIVMGTNYQNVLSKVTAYNVVGTKALPMTTTRTTNVTTAIVKDYGTYGFGGNVVNITGTIPNQSGNNNVSEIIAVNDLEDTMKSTGSTDVNTTTSMTVSQALTAMSNMTGMTDSEVKSLLNDKGVTINRNNESKNLAQDLGVTMVAVIYEQVNGINPDKVAIKDYTFYNKVKSSGTNSGYVKHIQVAKEVGIITEVPSTSKTVTVGEFLGMLSKAQ